MHDPCDTVPDGQDGSFDARVLSDVLVELLESDAVGEVELELLDGFGAGLLEGGGEGHALRRGCGILLLARYGSIWRTAE